MNADLPSPQALQELGPKAAAALWLARLQHDPSAEDDAAFARWLARPCLFWGRSSPPSAPSKRVR